MSNFNNSGAFQLSIRAAVAADAPVIARVHVNAWHTTYRGILPDEVLAAHTYPSRLELWTRMLREQGNDEVYLVAEIGSEIVGFASGGLERSGDSEIDGELYAIYLLNDWQHRGLGRALATGVANHLIKRGTRSMLVWVLSENPARAFYERLGGLPVRVSHVMFGEQEYEETGYGWPDIRMLTRDD